MEIKENHVFYQVVRVRCWEKSCLPLSHWLCCEAMAYLSRSSQLGNLQQAAGCSGLLFISVCISWSFSEIFEMRLGVTLGPAWSVSLISCFFLFVKSFILAPAIRLALQARIYYRLSSCSCCDLMPPSFLEHLDIESSPGYHGSVRSWRSKWGILSVENIALLIDCFPKGIDYSYSTMYW